MTAGQRAKAFMDEQQKAHGHCACGPTVHEADVAALIRAVELATLRKVQQELTARLRFPIEVLESACGRYVPTGPAGAETHGAFTVIDTALRDLTRRPRAKG